MSLIGAVLVIFGLIQILILVVSISTVGLAWLLFPLAWIPLIFAAVYIALGFGLHDRRMWAHDGTLVFMTLMFLFYLWILVTDEDQLISSGFYAVAHILIAVYVGFNRNEFEWKSTGKRAYLRPRPLEERLGLTCGECGSGNLDVYPDGSGICKDCRSVFSDIQRQLATTGCGDRDTEALPR